MKYVAEFRDPARIEAAREALRRATTRPWTIMEVCGGQTHTIARYAIEELIPESIEIVHGPGCPVCVTPLEVLGAACRIARSADTILCSFGDMLRVPGPDGDLLAARAQGADVRIVTSPLQAVRLAAERPDRRVVFFGVGFETTAPATAMAAERARELGLHNFSLLVGHVRVPPAIEQILAAPDNRVQGFLAAGHVCVVAGTAEYPPLSQRYQVPIAITGFEPLDILLGLLEVVRQLEAGEAHVENVYPRAVRDQGNPLARALVDKVYEVVDAPWRGLGIVPAGGLRLRAAYRDLDATRALGLELLPVPEPEACRAGEVLQGRLKPDRCPEFGRRCTPETPLGAPMVSTEGACAAYHRFRRRDTGAEA